MCALLLLFSICFYPESPQVVPPSHLKANEGVDDHATSSSKNFLFTYASSNLGYGTQEIQIQAKTFLQLSSNICICVVETEGKSLE